MEKEPLITLVWRGNETVEAIPYLLGIAREIRITLPLEYDHILFNTLHPDSTNVSLNEISVSDGPELLHKLASIEGLERLDSLGDALREAGATVSVINPPRLIITTPA